MKTLFLLTFLLIPTIVFSQSANDFFLQIPSNNLPKNRADSVTETKGDLLKFKISETKRGEVKIFAQKSDEALIGMAIADCDSSDLIFWKIKKGVWKDVTNEVIKPLGKADVIAILKVSPATVNSLNQSLNIAYFYNFKSDSTDLELFARKQDGCEVAGKVYDYKFNGKKFVIQK